MKKSYKNSILGAVLSIAGFAFTSSVMAQAVITQTFTFSGGIQAFTVPCGVTSVTIQAWGAEGGAGTTGGNGATGGPGGLGGYATGVLNVVPGDVLNMFIGGLGSAPAGGFNGGGNGGSQNAGGGGGATDVRINGTSEANRIIVAGGGGGGGRAGCEASSVAGGNGGGGGGLSGANGTDAPTSGGVAGGGQGGNYSGIQGVQGLAGIGCPGFSGSHGATAVSGTGGVGGAGQSCCCFSANSIPGGGGGGGGYLGGGGGGGGSAGTSGCQGNDKGAGGGGGGGSSYTVGLAASLETSNTWSGNGQCIISYNNPLPSAPTLAPDTICANQVSAISITPDTLATSYTWASTGDIVIVSGQGTTNITISSSGAGGTLSVYASNVCGDGPLSTVQTITVLAQPMVTITASAVSVCENEQITLSGNNALTYSWNNGVIDSVAFIPNDTSYTVTGTDTNGCTNTATQSIVIHSLPLVTLSSTMTGTFCGGQDVTLTGTPAGGVYSQVSGPASALISNVFNAPSQGAWTLGYTFTDANGCVNNDTIAFVIDCMVGLDLISANGKMNVYPIPNNGNFTIKSDLTSAGTLELFNVSGQLVYSQLIDNLSEKMIEIKDLTPGIYTVNIKSGEQLFSGKMTVTK